MAKAIKYFAEYAAENGEVNRVEIWVEGYVGAATEVICGGEPLLITRNKDVAETYLGGIVPTFYTFEFVSSSTFSASTFSSEAYGDVVIRHLRAGVLEFNAIVTPFVTSDDDLPATYYTFALQAECGIKYLANQKIDATPGNVRLIDILSEAMALIPRVDNFPFKIVDNTRAYTSAGLVGDGAPLFDRLISKRTFAGLTYQQAIEQIIANRCEVVLDAGAWWVRNIAELSEQYTQPSRTTNLVNYSATGVKGSTVAYRPELVRQRTKGGFFGSLFSQKNIKITRQEPEKINFLPNNDFKGPVTSFVPSGWTLGPTSFSYTVDNTNGSFQFANSVFSPLFSSADGAYLQSSSVEWRPLFTLNLANQTPETLTIRVRAELDTGIAFIRMQILATISDSVQYLTSEGSWSPSPAIYTQRADAVGRTGEFEINVPAPTLPGSVTTGNFDQSIAFGLRVRLFRGERAIQGPGGLEQPGFVRFREVSVFKDALLGDSFEELNSTFDFRGDPNADRGDVEEIETLIASRNGFPYRYGSLFTAGGAEIVGFESPFGLGITGANYANYLAQSFLAVSGKRLRTYEGTYFDTFNWSDILVIDNRAYRLHNFQESRKTRLVRVKLVELTFNSLLTTSIDVINNEVDRVVRNIVQIGAIPQDFNFVSSSNYDGRTVFGIRPDTRFNSTSVAELLLRANATAEDAGVSIKPGASDINLLTPAPLVVGVSETIATREWGNSVFQPLDADLTALAALSTVGVVRRTGAGSFATMAGTVNRVVKWGTNGELVDTIIRETGSSVVIGADTAIDSAFEVRGFGTNVARFQNGTATSQTILRVANNINTLLAIQAYGSEFSGGSVFSVGPNGVAVSQQGNGPLAVGTFGVSQPLLFGTNSSIRARILANGRFLIGTDTDAGGLLQVGADARFGNVHISHLAGGAIGLNRSPATGLLYNNTIPAYQIQNFQNRLELQEYNSSGSLLGRLIFQSNSLILNSTANTGETLQVQGTARIATSLTTPIIGNPAGVTANNSWTFSSNVNVPLLPLAPAHATSKQYVDNLVATGIKEGIPVRTIALTNITLSGTQTVSGVALAAGDRVLVAGQSTPSQNGPYIVASGSWSRASDSDTDLELRGFQYLILEGNFRNAKYRNTNESAITIGTTAINYVLAQGAEIDPIFSASPAFGITSQNILDWNSVFSAWGALVPNAWWDSRLATKTTTDLAEGTNLYYTNSRARAAISSNATGLNYDNTTGVFSLASGRVIPLQSTLDAFLTANQAITISGDATGIGTTAIALTLANSGVSAGTYKSVTVDAKGRVTAGSNPTTLAGYGITDAQPLDSDLTAIAAISGTGVLRRTGTDAWSVFTPGIADITGLQSALDAKQPIDPDLTAIAALSASGLLRKTGGVWGMDSNVYLTANQTINISGDATGSGTIAIALTLANSGVVAGTYGANNSIPRLTVDAKGRVTSATTITPSGVWGIDVSGYSTTLIADNNRIISPSELQSPRVRAGFTSWGNNDTAPYADYLHFNTWGDSTGGSQNLLMLRKSGIGMRIYQGSFGSVDAYSVFKDLAFTDGTNATGTWAINITGTAPWTGISGKPTTLSGYGITDAQPLDADLTAIAAISGTGILRRAGTSTWSVFTPGISDITGLQAALDAKQNINSRLTALINMSGTGAVRWNGTAFTAGAIAISDVTNLSTSLTALEILKDRTTAGPIDGVREVRSIDYYQGRMDFGFDKTLDVPYLFYDTGDRILANYMDNDGVWFHVDQTGNQRRYLRQGDTVAPVPSLQAVTDVSRNSSNRILFNNVPYALTTDIPNLQAVSAAGANSSIRLQLNGVGYATLAEIGGGGGGTVGSLAAVLGVGNNTNGIDINLNGLGVIRTGNVDGTPTVTIGNNANVDINSFNTVRVQSTNIRLSSGNLFGASDFVDVGVTLDSTRFSKLLMGTIDGQDGKYISLRGNFIGIRGVEATGSPSAMFLDAKQILIGSQTFGGMDVFSIAPSVITIGDPVGGSVLQPKFNFRPAAFTNGQKYVFQYNSSTNTFNLVPA